MTPEQEARIVLDYDAEFTDALLFGEKVCSSCGRKRPKCSPHFAQDASKDDGLKSQCSDCRYEQNRVWHKRQGRVEEQVDAELAERVVAKLRRRGLTISQIADGAGVNPSWFRTQRKTTSATILLKLVEFSEATCGKAVAQR